MKRWLFRTLSTLSVLVLLSAGASAVFFTSDEDQVNYRLESTEVLNDDLFVAAEEVVINGVVNGDVYAAGEMVTLTGEVTGDVYLAGSLLDVSGVVGEDLYLAGAEVSVNGASVGSSLHVGAANFSMDSASVVLGNVLLGSSNAELNGRVGRNVFGGAAAMKLNALVEGNVWVGAEAVRTAGDLHVNGDLNYSASDELELDSAVVEGELRYKSVEQAESVREVAMQGADVLAKLWGFLGALVVAWLLIWTWRKPVQKLPTAMKDEFVPVVVAGAVGLIFIPFAAVILMATVIGMPLGFLVLAGYAISLYLAKIVAAYWGGHLLFVHLLKKKKVSPYWAVALGLVLYYLLLLIPVVGGVARVLALVLGLGALIMYKWSLSKKAR